MTPSDQTAAFEKELQALVYRPVMDYEESMEPYFICRNKHEAEAAVNYMKRFMAELIKALPEYPEDGDAEPDLWTERDEARRRLLAGVLWPFGIDLHREIEYGASRWDENSIAVTELPVAIVTMQAVALWKEQVDGEEEVG